MPLAAPSLERRRRLSSASGQSPGSDGLAAACALELPVPSACMPLQKNSSHVSMRGLLEPSSCHIIHRHDECASQNFALEFAQFHRSFSCPRISHRNWRTTCIQPCAIQFHSIGLCGLCQLIKQARHFINRSAIDPFQEPEECGPPGNKFRLSAGPKSKLVAQAAPMRLLEFERTCRPTSR